MSERKYKKLLFEMETDNAVGFDMDRSAQIIVDHSAGVDAEDYLKESLIGCGEPVGCDLSITGVDVITEEELLAPVIDSVTSGHESLIIAYTIPPISLTAPTLSFDSNSGDDFNVSWNSIPQAEYYDIYMDEGSGYAKVNGSNITGTTYVLTSTSYSVDAYVVARSSSPYGYSDPSNIVKAVHAYQYFRLEILNDNGDNSFTGTIEFELRETVGGASIPVTDGGTATATSTNTSFTPDKAFDGSFASTDGWISQTAPPPYPQYLQYQFTSPKSITEWGIGTYPTTLDTLTRSFGEVNLQASNDGTNWTNLDYQDLRGTWTTQFELQTFEL